MITTRYLHESESTSHHPELGFSLRTVSRSTIEHRAVYAGTATVAGLYPGSNPVRVTDPFSALVRVTETILNGTTETYQIVDGVETELEPSELGPSTSTSIEWVVKGIGAVRLLFAFGEWLDPIISNSIFNNGSNVVGAISLEELIPESDIFSEHLRASGGNPNDAADTHLTEVGQEIILWPVPEEREYVFEADAKSQLETAAVSAGLAGDEALPEAIPQNDGVPNILKFAFNMDLASPDSQTLSGEGNSGLPAISIVEESQTKKLQFDFLRRKNSGLTYTPVYSTDLDPQTFSPATGTEIVTNVDALFDRVCVDMPIDFSDTNAYFGRIKVEY